MHSRSIKTNLIFILILLNNPCLSQVKWVYYNNSNPIIQRNDAIAILRDTTCYLQTLSFPFNRAYQSLFLGGQGNLFKDTTATWNNWKGTNGYKVRAVSDGFVCSFIEDYSTTIESDIYAKFNTAGVLQWSVGNDSSWLYIDFTTHNDTVFTLSNLSTIYCTLYDNFGTQLSRYVIDSITANEACRLLGIKANSNFIYLYGRKQAVTLPGDKRYLKIIDKNGNLEHLYIDSSQTNDRIIDIDIDSNNNYCVLSELNYNLTSRKVLLSYFNNNHQNVWNDTLIIPFSFGNAFKVYLFDNEIISAVTSGSTNAAVFSTNIINGTSTLLYRIDTLNNYRNFQVSKWKDQFYFSTSCLTPNGNLISFYNYYNQNLALIDTYLDTTFNKNLLLTSDSTGFLFGSGLYIGYYNFTSLGIHTLKQDQMLIYPNPATDKLFYNFNDGLTTVEVFNTIGKILIKPDFPSNFINIDSLEAGIYFIRFEYNNGLVLKKAFIKV